VAVADEFLLVLLLLLLLAMQAPNSVTFKGGGGWERDRGGGGDGSEGGRKSPPLTRGSSLPTALVLVLVALEAPLVTGFPPVPEKVVVDTRVAFTVVRSTDKRGVVVVVVVVL